MAKEDYEQIEKYKEAILKADRAADAQYEQRLAICKSCDKLNSGTCSACGCYVELRAYSKMGHCPHKKW